MDVMTHTTCRLVPSRLLVASIPLKQSRRLPRAPKVPVPRSFSSLALPPCPTTTDLPAAAAWGIPNIIKSSYHRVPPPELPLTTWTDGQIRSHDLASRNELPPALIRCSLPFSQPPSVAFPCGIPLNPKEPRRSGPTIRPTTHKIPVTPSLPARPDLPSPPPPPSPHPPRHPHSSAPGRPALLPAYGLVRPRADPFSTKSAGTMLATLSEPCVPASETIFRAPQQ